MLNKGISSLWSISILNFRQPEILRNVHKPKWKLVFLSRSVHTVPPSKTEILKYRKLVLRLHLLAPGVAQLQVCDSFHTLNILSVWTNHSLDQCLTYSYLISLMSSLHQLGIVLCHLHEEKLVATFLTMEYMSQPFSE